MTKKRYSVIILRLKQLEIKDEIKWSWQS